MKVNAPSAIAPGISFLGRSASLKRDIASGYIANTTTKRLTPP